MNLRINTIPQINYQKFENRNLESSQIQQREQNAELKNIGYTDLVFKSNVKSIPIGPISPLVDGLVSRMKFIFNIPSSKSSGAVTNMKSAYKALHNNKPHNIDIQAIKSNKNSKTNIEYKINIVEEGKSKGTEINMSISPFGYMTAGTFSSEDLDKVTFLKQGNARKILFNNLEYIYDDKIKGCKIINPNNQSWNAAKTLTGDDLFDFFIKMTNAGVSIIK